MKINIQSNDRNLRFYFPTGLIFNRTIARIGNVLGRKYAADSMIHISPEALEVLFTELGRIKKQHGTWELVKVESASGEIIEIVL